MDYFEQKKRDNLIFTWHNINPKLPYISMRTDTRKGIPIDEPLEGPGYWSHLSGRYRSALEQKEFIERGCVDIKLGKIRE